MLRTPVTSANISEVVLDKGVLHIVFKKGNRTYKYPGAGMAEYTALANAESVGGHFHAQIKPRFEGVLVPAL